MHGDEPDSEAGLTPATAAQVISHARVATGEAERLVKRLSAHWAHKWPVAASAGQARIELPFGCADLQAHADALTVTLHGKAGADQDRFEAVVAEHVQRMARDPLGPWDWRREAG